LWHRMSRTAPSPIPWGPFRLGIAGPYINIGALCYILFTFIWMPLPTVLPLDRFNMNVSVSMLSACEIYAESIHPYLVCRTDSWCDYPRRCARLVLEWKKEI
jgi:hypothetical protein